MFGMRTAGVLSFRSLKAWVLGCPLALRRKVCAGHLALIAVLSLVPAWLFPPSLAEVPGLDKWVHVAMYGVLGALFRWAAGVKAGPLGRWLPAAGAGYGFLMEFLQLWLGGGTRSFSWGDALANLAGVVLFWLLADRAMGRNGIMPSR